MTTHEDGAAEPAIAGSWSIHAEGQSPDPYGTVSIGRDPKVPDLRFLACRWTRAGGSPPVTGCGLMGGREFVASRCWTSAPSGVVVYVRNSPIRAEASWVFSGGDLSGRTGAGILDLKERRSPGEWGGSWQVQYTYPGVPPEKMRFRLEMDEVGPGLFKLEWHSLGGDDAPAGEPQFTGTGLQSGERLIACWAPRGSDVQLLVARQASQQAWDGESVPRDPSSRRAERATERLTRLPGT